MCPRKSQVSTPKGRDDRIGSFLGGSRKPAAAGNGHSTPSAACSRPCGYRLRPQTTQPTARIHSAVVVA